MSLTVHAYLKVIPPGNRNPEKPLLLQNFIKGVQKAGDTGKVINDYVHIPCDVAVLQGYVHPQSKHVPHLNLRRTILDAQKQRSRRTIIADSNLFLYADKGNTRTYLRYSYDGIFPTTAEYCWDTVDPGRWDQISRDLNITIKSQRKEGNHILICCQRDGGWSMDGMKVINWLHPLILKIRRNSDRPIRVRFHPGDKKNAEHMNVLRRAGHKVQFASPSSDIRDDFKNAHCLINHNSSPAVAAAIEGIPVFVTDPERSQAKDVAHTDLNLLENIKEFDRETWVKKISMSHWRLDELESGACWAHMRNWAKLI